MSELLKALQNLPPLKPKVFTVNIEGQSVVVSLEKKKAPNRRFFYVAKLSLNCCFPITVNDMGVDKIK